MILIDSLFILLSKCYIYFFNKKKDFWIVLPSGVLSFIISFNIMILCDTFYTLSVYWIILIYFGLYFLFFFRYYKDGTGYKEVIDTKVSKTIIYSIILLILINILLIILHFNYGAK